MTNSIKHQFFFPHPPQAVWEYLTNADLMEQWLMKNDFQPIIGYDFQFTIKPIPAFNFDGIIYCKVLKMVPFKKLSYSWKSGPGDNNIAVDSVVVWTLEAKENGTELFLTHSGFSITENLSIYNAMNDGWFKNIQKIADRLNAAAHGTPHA